MAVERIWPTMTTEDRSGSSRRTEVAARGRAQRGAADRDLAAGLRELGPERAHGLGEQRHGLGQRGRGGAVAADRGRAPGG